MCCTFHTCILHGHVLDQNIGKMSFLDTFCFCTFHYIAKPFVITGYIQLLIFVMIGAIVWYPIHLVRPI